MCAAELKKGIYHVFSQFGDILEVQLKKTYKMRGQAWVIFSEVQGASRAMREMQGFMFFGKPMRVNFAKQKSDVISKADGSFVARPKRKTSEEAQPKHVQNKRKQGADGAKGQTDQQGAAPMAVETAPEPPNRILFVQNLPEEATQQMLSLLFGQVQGYTEVRLVTGKKGIAFVEGAPIPGASGL